MSPVAAAFGALAFTFFSFNIVSIEAGHNSKVRAMTLAPLVLAVITTLRLVKHLCIQTLTVYTT
jgi:hypothetical protein